MCVLALGPRQPWGNPAPRLQPPPGQMSCLETMLQNVRDLWEDQLTLILQEIAREHKLDSRALVGRYVLRGQKDLSPVTLQTYPVPEGLPRAPVAPAPVARPPGGKNKGGRKPRFSTPPKLDGELTEQFLRTLTNPLLQEACKMRQIAVTGGKDVLVGRILKYQEDPQGHKPPRKGGRKKKEQGQEPQHNHTLDDRTHGGCPQCETYGNPLDPGMQQEEFQVTQEVPTPVVPSPPPAPMVPSPPPAPVVPGPPPAPVAREPEIQVDDFKMDDDDIDAQLKSIVEQMNGTTLGDPYDEYDEEEAETEDPFDHMEYGDMLEEED